MNRKRSLSALGVALGAALVLLVATQTASATYPGQNGRLAFGMSVAGNIDIYSAEPDGNGLTRLTTDPGFDACAASSADGSRIAFCSDRSGAFEIWTMDPDGQHQRQVTSLGGYATFPDISPDGTRIAFSWALDGDSPTDIYVADLDGSHLHRLTNNGSFDDYPVWSPDGKAIAFISDRSGRGQVWVMNSNGRGQRNLTRDGLNHDQLPDWSPDGGSIAYEANADDGPSQIWVMKGSGAHKTRLTAGDGGDDFGPTWSPDGSRIAYVHDPHNGTRPIIVMNADGSNPQTLLPGNPNRQFVPAWQPANGKESALEALPAAATAGPRIPIPKPKPVDLAKPFTGRPVSRAWLGTWQITNPGDGYGVLYRFYAASSPWCRSITAGRTTCFTMQPPGHLELWAGAATLAGGKVVLRMTYKPRPNTFACFADDPYSYRVSARTLTLLRGGPHACFFDQPSEFPVKLARQAS